MYCFYIVIFSYHYLKDQKDFQLTYHFLNKLQNKEWNVN